jgi:hypothetical protein
MTEFGEMKEVARWQSFGVGRGGEMTEFCGVAEIWGAAVA